MKEVAKEFIKIVRDAFRALSMELFGESSILIFDWVLKTPLVVVASIPNRQIKCSVTN